ncbi:MAG: ribonuclease III [Deltaproteobacteria bacterium]|nr:ribonuclease III [Deltaproteobacteria bacterium]
MNNKTFDESMAEFISTLPFGFASTAILKTAFTHKSFLNEPGALGFAALECNERLEFFGDAILSAAISETLYRMFPAVNEGELTRLRARLVNRRALAETAKAMKLGKYLLLGKGERASNGRENTAILAGVFEAFIAAVYFERGHDLTASYVASLFSASIEQAQGGQGHFDYKPALQELVQSLYKQAPKYVLINETGASHKKTFEVEVVINGLRQGRGVAGSKKEAEQMAAKEALERLKGHT